MKNPLRKRYKRELKAHAGRYVSIFIIYVVMVTIISGFLVCANNVRIAYEESHITGKVEDGQFAAALEVSDEALGSIEDLGTDVVQNPSVDFELTESQTLRVFENRSIMNLPILWEGELPQKDTEIAVDRTYASHHDIQVGDILRLDGEDFSISALISLVDYSSLFATNSDMMLDSFNFGVAVVTNSAFENFPENDVTHTYSYRFDERNLTAKEKIDLSDEIKEALIEEQVPLESFITQSNNQAISFFAGDMGSDVPMMLSFLFVIQIIMAFVFTVIISSTISEEAAVVGTLMASGYRRGELLGHYLFLPVVTVLAGALVGNVLSYISSDALFAGMYYNSYSLPPAATQFNLEALLYTTVLPIIFILILNVALVYRTLLLSPLRFLRRDLKRSRQKRAPKLPNISFLGRFRLRVIIQNIGSYLVLFFGILFASFILLFGICMGPVIENYVATARDASVSEYQYVLAAPYEAEESEAEKFSAAPLETHFEFTGKEVEITFYGIVGESKYWSVDTSELGSNEVIVSEELCKKIGIAVGDVVAFTDPNTLTSYELTVSGTIPYPAGFIALMPFDELNDLLGRDEGSFSGYFSNSKLNIPDEYVATVVTPEEMTKLAEQMTSTFGSLTSICLIASGVIYLVVLYILTKIIIDKNAPYISFMKVMGYRNKEIRKLCLTATTLFVAIALLVLLPLISYGIKVMFEFAFIDINGYFEPYIAPYSLALVALVGFACYLIINALLMRQIRHVDMAEVLKNRE